MWDPAPIPRCFHTVSPELALSVGTGYPVRLTQRIELRKQALGSLIPISGYVSDPVDLLDAVWQIEQRSSGNYQI